MSYLSHGSTEEGLEGLELLVLFSLPMLGLASLATDTIFGAWMDSRSEVDRILGLPDEKGRLLKKNKKKPLEKLIAISKVINGRGNHRWLRMWFLVNKNVQKLITEHFKFEIRNEYLKSVE